MSQSKSIHFERLTVAGLEQAIELVRDKARITTRTRAKSMADPLYAVNEFLLRPALEIVKQWEAAGLLKNEDAKT